MKKSILYTLLLLVTSVANLFAQDTLVGWTFPTATKADTFADKGITINRNQAIHLKADSMIMFSTMAKASPPASAQAMGLSNATAAQKGWYIHLNTVGYEGLKLYSKQNACMTHSGPKYWKVQYKLGASAWADVPSTNITCAFNFSTGVLNGVTLPLFCNNYSDVQLRWITISDSNVAGASHGTVFVTDTSMSRIDDIFITGTKIPNYGDTIVAWTFPTGTKADSLANYGLAVNRTSALHLKSDSAIKYFTGTYASPPACAQAQGLANATAMGKCWYIKISTKNYKNLKLFSKQNACKMHSAPKYWKLQYSITPGTWVDIPNGNITCGLNWTSAIVKNLALPVACENKDAVEIRWLIISDSNVVGSTVGGLIVTDSAMARIDDIFVFGDYFVDINSPTNTQPVNVYPNPASDYIYVETNGINEVSLINMLGDQVYTTRFVDAVKIETSSFNKGIYLLNIRNMNSSFSKRIIIQ